MLLEAVSCVRGTAEDVCLADVAGLAGEHRADRVPLDVAAVLVLIADVLAAVLIRAGRSEMRCTAVASFWVAAVGLWARRLAGALGPGKLDANRVPGAAVEFAAEGIQRADRLAAVGVIAKRVGVRFAACSGTGVTTFVHTAAGRFLASQARTGNVPLGVAAEGVGRTDCLAAVGVGAGRQLVLVAAIAGIEVAAFGEVAKPGATACALCQVDARRVPHCRAAHRVDIADRVATFGVVAGREGLRDETAPGGGVAAEAAAAFLGNVSAEAVPLAAAAEWVDGADRVATGGVVAEGLSVGSEAGSGAPVAAADVAAAQGAGNEGTVGVPLDRAATGVERTDARAAGLIITARVGVPLEAASDAGAVPANLGAATCQSFADTMAVPGLNATDRVGRADHIAARGVFAARRAMGAGARIRTRASRLSEADSVGVEGAMLVPGGGTTDRVDVADGRAADGLVATGQGMSDQAGASIWAAGALAAHSESDFDTHRVPPNLAAEGVQRRADVDATASVLATGEVGGRDEAGSRDGRPAASDRVGAQGFGITHAYAVPLVRTAERVDLADRIAAIRIGAGAVAVGLEAGTCGDVTAIGADDRGQIGAFLIPLEDTAVRVHRTDRFAAAGIVAAGASMAHKARSLARRAAVDRLGAQGGRGVLAGDVPGHDTAELVEEAHRRAALQVVAAWIDMHVLAGARGRISA